MEGLLDPDGRASPEHLASFCERSRERLRRIVRVRMSRQLQGKLDPDDVLQEAFLEAQNRLAKFLRDPKVEPIVWLRYLVCQKLQQAQRFFLAKKRSLRREVPLHRGRSPGDSSEVLRSNILDGGPSPSSAAKRTELKERVGEVLLKLQPVDQEILILRHFELLTTSQTAQALGISKAAARQRHLRALLRFKGILSAFPRLKDGLL